MRALQVSRKLLPQGKSNVSWKTLLSMSHLSAEYCIRKASGILCCMVLRCVCFIFFKSLLHILFHIRETHCSVLVFEIKFVCMFAFFPSFLLYFLHCFLFLIYHTSAICYVWLDLSSHLVCGSWVPKSLRGRCLNPEEEVEVLRSVNSKCNPVIGKVNSAHSC